MGKRALFYEIIIILFTAGGAAALSFGLYLLGTTASLFGICFILLAVGLFVASAFYYILGLNCAVKQLCLNRRAIGWIALFIPVAALLVAVVVVLFFGGVL